VSPTMNDQKEKAAAKRRKIHEFRGHSSSAAFVDEQVLWFTFSTAVFFFSSVAAINSSNFVIIIFGAGMTR